MVNRCEYYQFNKSLANSFFCMFEAMFYRIVKLISGGAALLSAVMVIGLIAGWFGVESILLVIQILLITFGLFLFYKSRSKKERKNSLIKLLMVAVHYLSIPACVLLVFAVKNESLAQNYWFILNAILIAFAGFVVIDLIVSLPINSIVKNTLGFLFFVLTIGLLLQMAGKLNQGQLILFSLAGMFVLTTLVVLFSGKKSA